MLCSLANEMFMIAFTPGWTNKLRWIRCNDEERQPGIDNNQTTKMKLSSFICCLHDFMCFFGCVLCSIWVEAPEERDLMLWLLHDFIQWLQSNRKNELPLPPFTWNFNYSEPIFFFFCLIGYTEIWVYSKPCKVLLG